MNTPESEKIQKILANLGFGSRRQIEEWIKQGRVSVNGEVATIGDRITLKDKVKLNNKVVNVGRNKNIIRQVIIYNKPEGEICSRHDPEGRTTVFESLPKIRQGRWVSIGRLDINSSGLLLFTNDGELANRLMKPNYQIEREYAVRVLGKVEDVMLKNLLNGVELEDGPAKFDSIKFAGGEGANTWYHVTLKEGRKREVRRLWESQELTVSRLIRVRYGDITLPRNLRIGSAVQLDARDVKQLVESVGL